MEREDAEFIVDRIGPARRELALVSGFINLYTMNPTKENLAHIAEMVANVQAKLKEVNDDAQQYLDEHPSEGCIDDDRKYDLEKNGQPIFKSHA